MEGHNKIEQKKHPVYSEYHSQPCLYVVIYKEYQLAASQ